VFVTVSSVILRFTLQWSIAETSTCIVIDDFIINRQSLKEEASMFRLLVVM